MQLQDFINGAEPVWRTTNNEEVGLVDFISCDLVTDKGHTVSLIKSTNNKGKDRYSLPQLRKSYTSVDKCRTYLKKTFI